MPVSDTGALISHEKRAHTNLAVHDGSLHAERRIAQFPENKLNAIKIRALKERPAPSSDSRSVRPGRQATLDVELGKARVESLRVGLHAAHHVLKVREAGVGVRCKAFQHDVRLKSCARRGAKALQDLKERKLEFDQGLGHVVLKDND